MVGLLCVFTHLPLRHVATLWGFGKTGQLPLSHQAGCDEVVRVSLVVVPFDSTSMLHTHFEVLLLMVCAKPWGVQWTQKQADCASGCNCLENNQAYNQM